MVAEKGNTVLGSRVVTCELNIKLLSRKVILLIMLQYYLSQSETFECRLLFFRIVKVLSKTFLLIAFLVILLSNFIQKFPVRGMNVNVSKNDESFAKALPQMSFDPVEKALASDLEYAMLRRS